MASALQGSNSYNKQQDFINKLDEISKKKFYRVLYVNPNGNLTTTFIFNAWFEKLKGFFHFHNGTDFNVIQDTVIKFLEVGCKNKWINTNESLEKVNILAYQANLISSNPKKSNQTIVTLINELAKNINDPKEKNNSEQADRNLGGEKDSNQEFKRNITLIPQVNSSVLPDNHNKLKAKLVSSLNSEELFEYLIEMIPQDENEREEFIKRFDKENSPFNVNVLEYREWIEENTLESFEKHIPVEIFAKNLTHKFDVNNALVLLITAFQEKSNSTPKDLVTIDFYKRAILVVLENNREACNSLDLNNLQLKTDDFYHASKINDQINTSNKAGAIGIGLLLTFASIASGVALSLRGTSEGGVIPEGRIVPEGRNVTEKETLSRERNVPEASNVTEQEIVSRERIVTSINLGSTEPEDGVNDVELEIKEQTLAKDEIIEETTAKIEMDEEIEANEDNGNGQEIVKEEGICFDPPYSSFKQWFKTSVSPFHLKDSENRAFFQSQMRAFYEKSLNEFSIAKFSERNQSGEMIIYKPGDKILPKGLHSQEEFEEYLNNIKNQFATTECINYLKTDLKELIEKKNKLLPELESKMILEENLLKTPLANTETNLANKERKKSRKQKIDAVQLEKSSILDQLSSVEGFIINRKVELKRLNTLDRYISEFHQKKQIVRGDEPIQLRLELLTDWLIDNVEKDKIYVWSWRSFSYILNEEFIKDQIQFAEEIVNFINTGIRQNIEKSQNQLLKKFDEKLQQDKDSKLLDLYEYVKDQKITIGSEPLRVDKPAFISWLREKSRNDYDAKVYFPSFYRKEREEFVGKYVSDYHDHIESVVDAFNQIKEKILAENPLPSIAELRSVLIPWDRKADYIGDFLAKNEQILPQISIDSQQTSINGSFWEVKGVRWVQC